MIQIIIVNNIAIPPVPTSATIIIFVLAIARFAVLIAAAKPPFINPTIFSFIVVTPIVLALILFLTNLSFAFSIVDFCEVFYNI